ncbi:MULTISPECIES: NADH:ubiquinone oxidoreductase subunit NDUFA12 [Aliiruegeria]|uniref:NADH:ubiquinone oxidoreductase subunit n=1 Tax=Aliiruegeria lutimaris TaxID=571298 RepID=A0A1G8IS27_9RHOB|nr:MULTISPECIES: NADH:ubiquinone oxidoreductase subunit NDUFA12 [Aliiruegeria]NDR55767.1 NADH:ubiquinone oxidoreductase subunit NDUFA12 [Pseudoruegeria sp. M32A2M]SDI21825.1 NADH:ubiquinone oxidoreductase subunit [Aliiruegeria lutimaris]
MGILNSVLRAITWWDGQTYGTQFFTSRHGEKVGEDEQGNVYYRNEDDSKRWVIFDGEIEASRIPPDWHGWLHKTFDKPPSERPLVHKDWEKPHIENMTASPELSYKPAGSLRRIDPVEQSDYEAWRPE